jgi:hypothetical protein
MKKLFAIFFFIFTAICLHAQTLSWDIKFLQGRGQESVPINRTIRMETGDSFIIAITPASDCYSYVVIYDSERQINVLYDKPLTGGNEIIIGPFETDNPPGNETLYIIMSLERQTRLENAIQTRNENPDSRQHANNLYREVVSLQNTASALGEPASVFIPVGGTTRSDSPESVTRFTEKSLYVRAITIRH